MLTRNKVHHSSTSLFAYDVLRYKIFVAQMVERAFKDITGSYRMSRYMEDEF